MKKLLPAIVLMSVLGVQAHAGTITPYVGADLGIGYAKWDGVVKYLDYDKYAAVMDLNVGVKFNKWVGLEASVAASSDIESDEVSEKMSYSSIGLDAVGYMPLCENWNLIGTAGFGYYTFDLRADRKSTLYVDGYGFENIDDIRYIKNKWAMRLGVGAQYDFNKNWAMRGLLRHAFVNESMVKSLTEVTVGVQYSF